VAERLPRLRRIVRGGDRPDPAEGER
jgi:hypothetical protein